MKQIRAIDIRLLGKKRTGDEAVFFNLTKELLALDQENEYLLLTTERNPREQALLQARLGCIGRSNVRFVALSGKSKFIWNLITVPWFLLRNQVDTYHTQYILPLFVPKRVRVVNHIHDVSFRAYPELISWKDRFFLWLFIPRSLRRTDAIVAPSQFTKDEIVRFFGTDPQKIHVVPNALSEDFLQTHSSEEVRRVQEKYQIPERYIISVGTLQPRKNIPLLLRAFARLREQLPDMTLVVVGNRTGHHVDNRIDQTIAELHLENVVLFPGYVEQRDLPLLVQGAQVFVFPSLYEGFGIPALEAMSQEVPVLCSATPCLQEVAGEAALYFDPTSIADCQEKLYTLLTDIEQRVSGISRGKGRLSLFSWRKSAELLSSVYKG